MIHDGYHEHEVQRGSSRTAQEIVRNVVKESLSQMGNVGPRKIQMELVKKLALVRIRFPPCLPRMTPPPPQL